MKLTIYLYTLLGLFFITACNNPKSEEQSNSISLENTNKIASLTKTDSIQKMDCRLEGEAIPENKFELKELERLVALTTSKDNASGWLEVYNTINCEQVNKIKLPANTEEDYPYYLAQIMYNKDSKLIGIRGFDKICLFDVKQNKLSEPLAPKYLNERPIDDASASKILRLEVWENYLIGYTAGNGAFVFDLENSTNPSAVLPLADFARKNDTYSSLFLLPNKNNNTNFHALIPNYDYEKEAFEIRSLFSNPQPLVDKINANSQGNRFIVLRENSEGQIPFVVDMHTQKLVDLPAHIQGLKNKQILHWVKEHV